MHNGLGRRADLESDNDHVRQYAGAAHADRSIGIGRERNLVRLLVITVTFLKSHAEKVGDINDQSGDRAATGAARNGVTSSQAIEFASALGDTMISRVTPKKSPHI